MEFVMKVLHQYRCQAYLQVLNDPIPRETLKDVDRRVNEAVEQGALACTCIPTRVGA
jgi:hypothetical protein